MIIGSYFLDFMFCVITGGIFPHNIAQNYEIVFWPLQNEHSESSPREKWHPTMHLYFYWHTPADVEMASVLFICTFPTPVSDHFFVPFFVYWEVNRKKLDFYIISR